MPPSSKNIPLSMLKAQSGLESAKLCSQRWLNLEPEFQRKYKKWDSKYRTRLIETAITGRFMAPITTVSSLDEKSDEIVDGMHRSRTLLGFMDDAFSLDGKHLSELDPYVYANKKFSQLPETIKRAIEDYAIQVNYLPVEIRRDPRKLKDTYEILNRSSQPLNEMEYHNVFMHPLFSELTALESRLKDAGVKIKNNSTRFSSEEKLLQMMVVSCISPEYNWSSMCDLYVKWIDETFFNTIEDKSKLTEHIKALMSSTYSMRLNALFDLLVTMNKVDFTLSSKWMPEELIFIGRLLNFIYSKSNPEFLICKAKHLYNDIQKDLEHAQMKIRHKNAKYQQLCLEIIDERLKNLA